MLSIFIQKACLFVAITVSIAFSCNFFTNIMHEGKLSKVSKDYYRVHNYVFGEMTSRFCWHVVKIQRV